jgi:hypothetical protein
MGQELDFDPRQCVEDCPRCNRCAHTSPRRIRMEALVRGTELENLRYEADRLPIPPSTAAEWHTRAMQAVGR